MQMQRTPKSVTEIASAISAMLSGAADLRRYAADTKHQHLLQSMTQSSCL
jgi:hypothetical protein